MLSTIPAANVTVITTAPPDPSVHLARVPPQVIAILGPLHLFGQFWYHTKHIGKLGWLEYILVTPSQHRVHHAINKEYIDKIDAMGGAVEAIRSGYQANEIHQSAYSFQSDVENEETIVVGVNKYNSPTPPIAKLQKISQKETDRQLKRLASVKSTRDDVKVAEALSKLRRTAEGSENTMPAILECVEAYATVGEISDVLRHVFGEQGEFVTF